MSQESNPFHSGTHFDEFGLNSTLVGDLFVSHFEEASAIQKEAIPKIITPDENGDYRSLLAQSQNGTGKTLAFTVGLLQRINNDDPSLQAICLLATRELVIQTYTDYVEKLTRSYVVKTTVLITDPPVSSDPSTAQLILSTPMQLDQAIRDQKISIETVRVLAIDEADFVLENKTFLNFFNYLFQRLTQNRTQFLLFSATLTEKLHRFISEYITNIDKIVVEKNKQFIPTNKHLYIDLSSEEEKIQVLSKIFKSLVSSHTFIFVNRKVTAEALYKVLKEQNLESQFISSEIRRRTRDEIIKRFKEGTINVLICTNMLARGLDIPVARAVVNFDMPLNKGEIDLETYMHRQGRTGRYERNGVVINFLDSADPKEHEFIDLLEKEYNLTFEEFKNDDENIQHIFQELSSVTSKKIEE